MLSVSNTTHSRLQPMLSMSGQVVQVIMPTQSPVLLSVPVLMPIPLVLAHMLTH